MLCSMSGGGYGRGGRGAALLQALNAPVRKPGEAPQTAQATQPKVSSFNCYHRVFSSAVSQTYKSVVLCDPNIDFF